jgi:hypothetical protein
MVWVGIFNLGLLELRLLGSGFRSNGTWFVIEGFRFKGLFLGFRIKIRVENL